MRWIDRISKDVEVSFHSVDEARHISEYLQKNYPAIKEVLASYNQNEHLMLLSDNLDDAVSFINRLSNEQIDISLYGDGSIDGKYNPEVDYIYNEDTKVHYQTYDEKQDLCIENLSDFSKENINLLVSDIRDCILESSQSKVHNELLKRFATNVIEAELTI